MTDGPDSTAVRTALWWALHRRGSDGGWTSSDVSGRCARVRLFRAARSHIASAITATYAVMDARGEQVGTVSDAGVRFVGGFAHRDVPGAAEIQVVSAPAVRRISSPRP